MVPSMRRALQTKQPELMKQNEKEKLFGRTGYQDKLVGNILFLCSEAGQWFAYRAGYAD